MAENSGIAWTHNTFNPWIGCVKVSQGCKNCYAETLVKGRMNRPGLWGPAGTARRDKTKPAYWLKARAWNNAAAKACAAMRVFSASLADIFEEHPDLVNPRREFFELIKASPFLQFQLLTKRPENIARMLPDDWGNYGYPNVWLGTSVEDMRVAARVDKLREIPAVVRFISYEPALGPLNDLDLARIDWVIFGGESGPGFREMDVQWARDMRDKCDTEGVVFFFKQSAAIRTEMGTTLDGQTVRDYPLPRSAMITHRGQWPEMTDAAFKAYRRRYVLDTEGTPGAPFYEEKAERVLS